MNVFNALGKINCRWKARIDWRNYINNFDMFAVSEGKGKLEKILKKIFEFFTVLEGKGELEKIFVKISSTSLTSAPAAWGKLEDILEEYLLVSPPTLGYG